MPTKIVSKGKQTAPVAVTYAGQEPKQPDFEHMSSAERRAAANNGQQKPNPTRLTPAEKEAQDFPGTDPSKPETDLLWQKTWASISQAAKNAGITEEEAWKQFNEAGRPRGRDNESWRQALLSPQAQVNASGQGTVTPDAGLTEAAKISIGLDKPGQVEDPRVTAAIKAFQGSDTESRQQAQDALDALKTSDTQTSQEQQALIKQLQEAAAGRGPSAAEALFKLALGKNIAAQKSAAAGVRGGGAAAAARAGALAGEGMQREAALTATALRSQEQQQAMAQLGTTVAQARGADIEKAASVASIADTIRGQDIAKAQIAAGLIQAQSALEDSKRQAQTNTALSLLNTDLGAQETNYNNLLAKLGLQQNYDQGNAAMRFNYDQLRFQKQQADQQFAQNLLLGILGGGSTLGAALIGKPGGSFKMPTNEEMTSAYNFGSMLG